MEHISAWFKISWLMDCCLPQLMGKLTTGFFKNSIAESSSARGRRWKILWPCIMRWDIYSTICSTRTSSIHTAPVPTLVCYTKHSSTPQTVAPLVFCLLHLHPTFLNEYWRWFIKISPVHQLTGSVDSRCRLPLKRRLDFIIMCCHFMGWHWCQHIVCSNISHQLKWTYNS